MADPEDYYQILGVERTASQDEIRQAFRNVALKCHPDRNPGNKEAEERFKKASQAFDVLSDEQKRRRYDQYGAEGLRGYATRDFEGASFEDIFRSFGDIFGADSSIGDFFGMGRGRSGPRPGASLRVELELEFKEAALGVERKIDLWRHERCGTCEGSGSAPGKKRESCRSCGGRGMVMRSAGFFSVQSTCPACGGQGEVVTHPCADCGGRGLERVKREITVKIPAGIEDSTRMRLSGQGEASRDGGPPGDLYVDVFVKEHPFFKRDGADLHCEVPVGVGQASLGAEIEIPTLDGRATLKVPRGTQPGTVLRLKGQGLSRLQGRGRGDLHAHVTVQVPTKLSRRQEELLQELAKLEAEPNGKKGFFDKWFGS